MLPSLGVIYGQELTRTRSGVRTYWYPLLVNSKYEPSVIQYFLWNHSLSCKYQMFFFPCGLMFVKHGDMLPPWGEECHGVYCSRQRQINYPTQNPPLYLEQHLCVSFACPKSMNLNSPFIQTTIKFQITCCAIVSGNPFSKFIKGISC